MGKGGYLMALVTSQSPSSSYYSFGPSCGLAYNYSTVTDDPGSLTPWAESVEPDVATFTSSLYMASAIDGYWIGTLTFSAFRTTRSYGFGDDTGLTYEVIAHIGGNTITSSGTGLGAGGIGLYNMVVDINDFVDTNDYIELNVTCFYPPRFRTGVGFNRGWEARHGGGANPMFHLTNSTWATGCAGASLSGSSFYPWHQFTYDPNVVQSTNGMGYSNSEGISATYGVDIGSWEETQVSGETYFLAEVLRFAQAGSYSSVYRVDNFTKTCVIGVITGTGQLDVEVSSDKVNFVTYDSITSDGYVELIGFKYIRLYVNSGEVGAASIVSQRKIGRLSIEPVSLREPTRLGRLISSRRGWGKGDT